MISGFNRTRILTAILLAMAFAWPVAAEAQRRSPRGPSVRTVVYIGSGWYGPRYVYYDPYWQGRYGPYPPYGYYSRYDVLTTSIRLDVSPRQAQVFVDGYAAGIVDEFDGIFQRLRLEPGGHDITLYLPGYRTVTESLYLRPGADQRIRLEMERLSAGEVSEPPPAPAEAPAGRTADRPRRGEGAAQSAAPEAVTEAGAAEARGRFGSLALQIQPADAEIFIDGERWAPTGETRVSIRLPEGRHRVEVRKPGLSTFTEDVLIQRNRTLTLNVVLGGG